MNNNKHSKAKQGKSNSVFRPQGPITCVTLRETVPDTMQVPLTYSQDVDFTGAVIQDQVFNLNSIFDPDRTGVGHQPQGADAWNNFYNRYRVDATLVEIDLVNLSTTSVADILVVASNDAAAISTQTTFDSGSESAFSWNDLMSVSAGNNIRRFRKLYKCNQVTGITATKYNDDDIYGAQWTSNPTEIIVLHICAKDFSFTTNVAVKARVKLTYYVTMFDRQQLGQS
jgi:hypothetical protein